MNPPVPWWKVFRRVWPVAAALVAAALGLVLLVWGARYSALLYDLILRPEDAGVRAAQALPRAQAWRWALGAIGLSSLASLGLGLHVRRGGATPPTWPFWLLASLFGLPVLGLPTFEFEHPYLTGLLLLTTGLASASALVNIAGRWPGLQRIDLDERQGLAATGAAFALFVVWIGFIAHWRYATFHAQFYDFSWEVNAVAGITRHGVPTISCAASHFYPKGPMPALYFNLHVPLVYYLYAPIFALIPTPPTVLWLQTIHMGLGAFGVYWASRRWVGRRWLAVIMAIAYLANPNIQNHALHDLHANNLAIPTMLLAMGLMETKRLRWAIAAAVLTALCREETPLYSACLGVYWMVSAPHSRRRMLTGFGLVVGSLAWLVFVTKWLMPHYGGHAGMRHFSFFYDQAEMDSVLRAFLLNPLGALVAQHNEVKLAYIWMTLLPFGLLSLRGWRGWPIAVLALPLSLAAGNPDFFILGINYAAPMVPAAIVLSLEGARSWLAQRAPVGPLAHIGQRRFALGGFILFMALSSNYLYGNIFAKTYKFEYGMTPHRRWSINHYENRLSYVPSLPPYGNRERAIWEAIHKVPKNVVVSTSWLLNPNFSHYDVAYVYPDLGQNHAPQVATWVILDKLPLAPEASELFIREMRGRNDWEVAFENAHAVVFKKKGK